MEITPTNKTAKLRKNASLGSVYRAVEWDIATRHDQVYGTTMRGRYVDGEVKILYRWRQDLQNRLDITVTARIDAEICGHFRKVREARKEAGL